MVFFRLTIEGLGYRFSGWGVTRGELAVVVAPEGDHLPPFGQDQRVLPTCMSASSFIIQHRLFMYLLSCRFSVFVFFVFIVWISRFQVQGVGLRA